MRLYYAGCTNPGHPFLPPRRVCEPCGKLRQVSTRFAHGVGCTACRYCRNQRNHETSWFAVVRNAHRRLSLRSLKKSRDQSVRHVEVPSLFEGHQMKSTHLRSEQARKNGAPLSQYPVSCLAFWCPEEDSNLHTLRHTDLNRARLPIPPPGH